MPEQTVWRGTSSQWKNFGVYLLWGIASVLLLCFSMILWGAASGSLSALARFLPLLLVVPITMVVARYLTTRNKVYELTTERVKITEGVFSKTPTRLSFIGLRTLRLASRLLADWSALKTCS